MLILSINWTNAFIITFLGLVIVFTILCLLIGLLKAFGWVVRGKDSTKTEKTQKEKVGIISGKESAAVAMALHLYYADIHDEESNVITIRNISNRYSPWSSKIYGIQFY